MEKSDISKGSCFYTASLLFNVFLYIYVCVCVCVCIHIHIYQPIYKFITVHVIIFLLGRANSDQLLLNLLLAVWFWVNFLTSKAFNFVSFKKKMLLNLSYKFVVKFKYETNSQSAWSIADLQENVMVILSYLCFIKNTKLIIKQKVFK